MCISHIERYGPPDKTKSPRTLQSQDLSDLRAKKARIATDAAVQTVLNLVSVNNLEKSILELSNFHNRHSKSIYIHEVADWIQRQLLDIGFNDVSFHDYNEDGFDLKNVICNKGVETEEGCILLTAHYDTVLSKDPDDVTSRMPGANDNASGVSALLEIASVLSGIPLQRRVKFAFFSGEEQGLWGSTHYAQHIKESGEKIHVVVNMDMCGETGFLANDNLSYIDIDNGETGTVDSNNIPSKNFGLKMQGLAEVYTQIDTIFDPIDASDYMPFESRGYVCIGAYDGSAISENPHYHDSSDVISNLNMNFLNEVTKMVLAFVLSETK